MRDVVIVPGHPNGAPGAVHDLDGDGCIEVAEWEAARNRVLADALYQSIVARGGRCRVVDEPTYYASRHVGTDWIGANAGIFVHVHHDTGNGRMILHDLRSQRGKTTSQTVCASVAPILHGCRAVPAYDDRNTVPKPWLHRSWSLVQGLYVAKRIHGIVLELLTVRDGAILDTSIADYVAEGLSEVPL